MEMNRFIVLKKILLLFIVIAYALSGKSQDLHLSQHDAAPLYLNPALVGMFDGDYRVHLHYRTQWNSIASKPFTTAAASFDIPFEKFAFGAQVMNNRAGAGKFNVFNFTLNGGYNFAVDKNDFHNFSIGLQAGIIQKSIDESSLYFENQYSYAGGGSFDQSVPSGETFSNTNFWMVDATAGLLYFYGEEQARINPFVGYSLFHINEPEETFYSQSNNLPMRHVIHGGLKINITDRIQVMPKALSMQQENDKELNIGSLVHYHIKEPGVILIFGPTFRSKDAAIVELGAKFGPYEGRISYDINTSSLNDYTDGKGGFEISFTYIPKKHNPNPVNNCPRL